MSAALNALKAWDRVCLEREAAELDERHQEERERRRLEHKVAETIKASMLDEWFPAIKWDLLRHNIPGADFVVAPEPDHEFMLGLRVRGAGADGVIASVGEVVARDGHPHWEGQAVSELSEIGKWIEQRALAKLEDLDQTLLDALEAHPAVRPGRRRRRSWPWLDAVSVAAVAGLRMTPEVATAFNRLGEQGKIKLSGVVFPSNHPTNGAHQIPGGGGVSPLTDDELAERAERGKARP